MRHGKKRRNQIVFIHLQQSSQSINHTRDTFQFVILFLSENWDMVSFTCWGEKYTKTHAFLCWSLTWITRALLWPLSVIRSKGVFVNIRFFFQSVIERITLVHEIERIIGFLQKLQSYFNQSDERNFMIENWRLSFKSKNLPIKSSLVFKSHIEIDFLITRGLSLFVFFFSNKQ